MRGTFLRLWYNQLAPDDDDRLDYREGVAGSVTLVLGPPLAVLTRNTLDPSDHVQGYILNVLRDNALQRI